MVRERQVRPVIDYIMSLVDIKFTGRIVLHFHMGALMKVSREETVKL